MQKQKQAISLILLSLVMHSVIAYSFSSENYGFLVYETHTQAWQIDLGNIAVGIPKSFNVTVECKEERGEFLVTYYLEITGPGSLCDDYLRLRWRDTDGLDFTIGKNGDQTFFGIGTICWKSSFPVIFEVGHKNNITITLTFLTTAAIGNYNAKMWVIFTEKPIQAQVLITPKVLNIESEGEGIHARICLPTPYNVRDIDINSVKLWFKDRFVQIEWWHITGKSLLVKFSRAEALKMLESEEGKVNLIVTGLVNGIEFYGTDTMTIIAP
ncbi:MAG: hypothetical protein ACUVUF_08780 [Candidatus Bathycorpusculaceae bacterium]